MCMEDFKLDESVRQLPCQHMFHTDCIVPWLELVSLVAVTVVTAYSVSWGLGSALYSSVHPQVAKLFNDSLFMGQSPLSGLICINTFGHFKWPFLNVNLTYIFLVNITNIMHTFLWQQQ